MGAGASASPQNAFTAEQKAEIKKQCGVKNPLPKGWIDGSDLTDLDAARKEVVRLRKLVAEAVSDSSTSRGTAIGAGAMPKQREAVRDAGLEKNEKYTPVKFEKSDAIVTMLREMFKTNKLFQKSLLPSATEEAQALIDAFECVQKKAGEIIIKQGDQGDYFYVIEEGEVSISVKSGSADMNVGTVSGLGRAFGELALL